MSGTESTETVQTDEDDSPATKGLNFFGTDLTKIPCMRTSLLNGYIGAVVGGLAGFFYTSKARIGFHSAFASYWIVASGTWVTCRYKEYEEKKQWEGIIKAVENKALKTGEYNIPKAVKRLNEKPDGLNTPPEKDS